MTALLSVAEALSILLESVHPVDVDRVNLDHAVGRVLAEEIRAGFDLPVFTNSAMDGFAVHAIDVNGATRDLPVSLDVIADIPAGSVCLQRLALGQAARIMTGAPLPEGADAVVPVEDTDFTRQTGKITLPVKVHIFRAVRVGDYVRLKGKDIRERELLINPGTRLRPQEVGLLAMLGITSVIVYRRPRLAILPTGDELTPVGTSLLPGKIYESNTYTLCAQAEQSGAEVVSLGLVPDRLDAVVDAFNHAVEAKVDCILSSAGVSVGAHDYVREAVESDGKLVFWRVNMRPGKPLAFGYYRGTPFIGLPGNPVSSFASFEVFVRPVLHKLAGQTDWSRIHFRVELLESIESDGRESYLRAIVTFRDGHAYARLTGNQDSGNLRSLIQANALLIIPNEVKCLPIGAEAQVWLL